MKIAIGIVGLAVGLLLGGALLMLNPITLTQARPAVFAGPVRSLAWQSGGGYRGFEVTPYGLLGARNDRGPALGFREPAIRYARVEVVTLSGEDGSKPALGVRLSAIARPNSLVRARLGVATAWNIIWPDRGTLLLSGSENLWKPLRDGLWSAVRGRGFQPGKSRYPLPAVPGLQSPALVGGSGPFTGARGAFREEFAPVREHPGDLIGRRELQLAIE
jgi:hypothetical protein